MKGEQNGRVESKRGNDEKGKTSRVSDRLMSVNVKILGCKFMKVKNKAGNGRASTTGERRI